MRDIVTIATLLAFFVSPSYAGDWKNAVNRATDRAVNGVVNGAIRFADPKGEADASTRRLMQGAGKAFIDPRPSRRDKHWDNMIDAAKDVRASGGTRSPLSTGENWSHGKKSDGRFTYHSPCNQIPYNNPHSGINELGTKIDKD